MNLSILEGKINVWKDIIELNEGCGAYVLHPDRKAKEDGILEGLELAYKIINMSEEDRLKYLETGEI